MNMNKTLLAAFGSALLACSAPALADDDDRRHYEQNRAEYISHEKASEIASKTVDGGRVTDVEFDRDWNGDHFDVEVLDGNGREYDVVIDARSGKVLSSRQDR